ncbi:aryl-sulfate sulfotransferase [Roseibium polysiphoniae]|uniref:Aryl-sulfate sulfotransferase n=1 Tax=Roseibium polysiphoniae TaxID=2571221 RepID=A0A944CBK2_9HYPH|nr:ribbon-helix-helix domain-containing protein [Roseibium polysiphoniae]MBD8876301.1 ribbon-helix-helix domain-containing protein [Roseibium polysiphoniae]MBS8260336.1 aryl-sulfate sulfotransferase [Roseibium polysiphoniae]
MALTKRSLALHGHRTSLALEPEFWAVIDQAARDRELSLASLIAEIDDNRDPDDALSSSVRIYALAYVQNH